MTAKDARMTAATRGFKSVKAWMKANRAAAANFASRKNKRGEDRNRLDSLIRCLDNEHKTFSPFA